VGQSAGLRVCIYTAAGRVRVTGTHCGRRTWRWLGGGKSAGDRYRQWSGNVAVAGRRRVRVTGTDCGRGTWRWMGGGKSAGNRDRQWSGNVVVAGSREECG
jgi:hypothetical protein